MIKKLRNKLLFFNMLILSVIIFCSFATIYAFNYSNIQKENTRKISALPLTTLGRAIATNPSYTPQNNGNIDDPFIIWSYSALPIDYTQSFIICIDENGNITDIYSNIDMQIDVYVSAANKVLQSENKSGKQKFENRVWQYKIDIIQSRPSMPNSPDFQTQKGKITQISFLDVTDSHKSLLNLLLTCIFVGIGMLVILLFVSLFFANRTIRPIEENWIKQKQFISDASHELKTPLAIINANMDAMRSNNTETVANQTKWMSYIDTEINRMNKLVSDLLYLSKSETIEYQGMPFDFSQAASDTISEVEAIIYENNIDLVTNIQPSIFVNGDEEKLRRVMLILLDNAAKYTPLGCVISVKLEEMKGNAVFTVLNSGTTIPPEKLPHIFDRFYRVDDSRNSENDGYGLGLSIAKTIVERAEGHISVQSQNNLTIFTVVLKSYS